MTARNIWTNKFGSDRRLTGIGLLFSKNIGRGRKADMEPPIRSVFRERGCAHARPERRWGHPCAIRV